MKHNFCPKCGSKWDKESTTCKKCGYSTNLVSNEKNMKSKSSFSKVISGANFIPSLLFSLCFVFLYLIIKEVLIRGSFPDGMFSLLLITLLFYVTTLTLYTKYGGYAIWLVIITSFILLIPEYILYSDFKQFYDYAKYTDSQAGTFMLFPICLLLLTTVINIINLVVILNRRRKKVKINT